MVRSMGSMTTMDNQEEILDALNDFEKKPNQEIPPVLEQFLLRIAKTGETLFPWPRLKPLLVSKLDEVMKHFNQEVPGDHFPMCPNVENVRYDDMRSRILASLDAFHGAPFTIQRLCELITNPKRHYNRSDKFLRGIEKNVLVVSTVDPFGRKIVSESRNLVNGLDTNGQVELRDGVSGSNHPPLWASKNTVGVWPFHHEGAHNSTMVCPLEISTSTDKASSLQQESMESSVSTVQDSNEMLQQTEDMANSQALHPVQEAVVETSLAQPSHDLMNSSVEGQPGEEVTSESVEIHSVLVENCAIPESLPNFSSNTVVTSNMGKDSFSSEVISDGSLTVTSQGVCESVLAASNTVSVVTSDAVQECVLTSQSFDSGTSDDVLDSTVNKLGSECEPIESVSHVTEGSSSQEEAVVETVGRSDLCQGSSEVQGSALHHSSQVEISTCTTAVSSSQTATSQPASSTGVSIDESLCQVSAGEALKQDDKAAVSGNDMESRSSTDLTENTSNASAEEVTIGSSENDTCHTLSTKPDSTLPAETLSTDCVTSNESQTAHSTAIDTDRTDSADSEEGVDMDRQEAGDSDGVVKSDKPDTSDVLVTGKLESGDCEGMVGVDKPDAGQCTAVSQVTQSAVGDGMALSSSCSSDQDTSVNCSSVVEQPSHAEDTGGELVTPDTQPAAANMTEAVSVESTVSTDTPVSDNTSDVESAHDPTPVPAAAAAAAAEPMDQD